jgi:hypothetical protein
MTPLRMGCDQCGRAGGEVSGKIAETGDQLVAAPRGAARYAHRTIAPRARIWRMRRVAIGSTRGVEGD